MAEQNERPGIPIHDAIQELADIYSQPVVSNMNAEQIQAMKRLSAEDYDRLRGEYRGWMKQITFLPIYVYWVILGLLCLVSFFLQGWGRYVWIFGLLVLGGANDRRQQHEEGYVFGFKAGVDFGINRALRLTPERAQELRKMAIDAEIWRGHAQALRKQ